MPDRAPRGMMLTACIFGVIPYVNFLIGLPIMWTIAVCMLQSSVNRVARLGPTSWDANTYGVPPGGNFPPLPPAPPRY